MWWIFAKVGLSALIITAVSGLSQRFPRAGALILSLPIVSTLAFVFAWIDYRDLQSASRLARETLVLVPLPFFVPLAFADRLGLDFWPAFLAGVLMASTAIGIWLWFAPAQI